MYVTVQLTLCFTIIIFRKMSENIDLPELGLVKVELLVGNKNVKYRGGLGVHIQSTDRGLGLGCFLRGGGDQKQKFP